MKLELDEFWNLFEDPIVTETKRFRKPFYPAEEAHQEFL